MHLKGRRIVKLYFNTQPSYKMNTTIEKKQQKMESSLTENKNLAREDLFFQIRAASDGVPGLLVLFWKFLQATTESFVLDKLNFILFYAWHNNTELISHPISGVRFLEHRKDDANEIGDPAAVILFIFFLYTGRERGNWGKSTRCTFVEKEMDDP